MERLRGGLVVQAQILLYHSTLDSDAAKKKKVTPPGRWVSPPAKGICVRVWLFLIGVIRQSWPDIRYQKVKARHETVKARYKTVRARCKTAKAKYKPVKPPRALSFVDR